VDPGAAGDRPHLADPLHNNHRDLRLRYRWVAVAQVPYFIWVSIATVLQLSITWMNRE